MPATLLAVALAAACSRSPLLVARSLAPDDQAPEPRDAAAASARDASSAPGVPVPPIDRGDAGGAAPIVARDSGVPQTQDLFLCPNRDETGVGTNTAIVVRAAAAIDPATAPPSSVAVKAGASMIAGSVEVHGNELHFVPDAPLPANAALQVALTAEVRDQGGRLLAPRGETWSFKTGAAGTRGRPGMTFTVPRVVPLGEHAISHVLAGDGDRPLLAWSTAHRILGCLLNADGTFGKVIEAGPGSGDELSVSIAGDVAHFAWVDFGNGTVSLYIHAPIDASVPASEPVRFPPSMFGVSAYEPVVAADIEDHVAVAWSSASAENSRVATSDDGGETFSSPTLLDGNLCPALLYADGYLVVAWLYGGLPGGGKALHVMASSDNGSTFSEPVTIADANQGSWCPQLIAAGDRDVLILFDEGSGIGGRATELVRFTPSTGTAGEPLELYPRAETNVCSSLSAASDGRLLLVHSDKHVLESDAVSEVRISEDRGLSFGPPAIVDVIDAGSACPAVALGTEAATLAWRRNDYELVISRGLAKRPCQ